MSKHKELLTVVEESGLIVHGLGNEIGKPSIIADIFRLGVSWGEKTTYEKIEAIKTHEEYLSLFKNNVELKIRLSELKEELEESWWRY